MLVGFGFGVIAGHRVTIAHAPHAASSVWRSGTDSLRRLDGLWGSDRDDDERSRPDVVKVDSGSPMRKGLRECPPMSLRPLVLLLVLLVGAKASADSVRLNILVAEQTIRSQIELYGCSTTTSSRGHPAPPIGVATIEIQNVSRANVRIVAYSLGDSQERKQDTQLLTELAARSPKRNSRLQSFGGRANGERLIGRMTLADRPARSPSWLMVEELRP